MEDANASFVTETEREDSVVIEKEEVPVKKEPSAKRKTPQATPEADESEEDEEDIVPLAQKMAGITFKVNTVKTKAAPKAKPVWQKVAGAECLPPAASQEELNWAAMTGQEKVSKRAVIAFQHQKIRAQEVSDNVERTLVVSSNKSMEDGGKGSNMTIEMMKVTGFTPGPAPAVCTARGTHQ